MPLLKKVGRQAATLDYPVVRPMPHACSEDQLIKQAAIQLFSELGWVTVSAIVKTFGFAERSLWLSYSRRGSWLGRETKSEVVLLPRLRAALGSLNRDLPEEAIELALIELNQNLGCTRDLLLPPLISDEIQTTKGSRLGTVKRING